MATYTLIKLTHLTPIHIGTGKENYDFSASDLQSDTISAALAAIRAQLGKTEDLEEFLNSFVISSAFPFWMDHLFLPKPQGKLDVKVEGKEEHEYRKALKNIKFIDFSLWQEIINGKAISVEENQIQNSFLLTSGQKYKPIFISQVNQRVTVPREDGQEAKPFFFDWKFFNKDAGLYCLTDASGGLLDEITQLFSILGQNGIGTDRNIGGGKFEVQVSSNYHLTFPDNANSEMLLSLYIPTEQEVGYLHLPEANYSLLLRGGYMAGSQEEHLRHLRKKSIYMFDVGSVFPTLQSLYGKVVDLRPTWNDENIHSVFRSGKPLCVPIKVERYEQD